MDGTELVAGPRRELRSYSARLIGMVWRECDTGRSSGFLIGPGLFEWARGESGSIFGHSENSAVDSLGVHDAATRLNDNAPVWSI